MAAAALSALAVLAMRIDFGPMPEVTRFRDDAYYIFAWARSLAAGEGPCVTPGVPTTGLNLSWGLLLALAGWLLGAGAIPVAAQVLGLLCHAGFAAVAARLAGGGTAGALVGLLALGNPWLLVEAQNGQETAMAVMLVALLVLLRRAPAGLFWSTGLLLLFTRSDAALFVLAVACVRSGSLRACAGVAAQVAVHVLVQLAIGGHPLQDSAAPIPWLFWQHEQATYGGLTGARLWWWLRPVLLGGPYQAVGIVAFGCAVGLVYRAWLPARWIGAPLAVTVGGLLAGAEQVFVAVTGSALALVAPRRSDPDRVVTAMVAASVALVCVHVLIRHVPRDYYFAPLAVPAALAAGIWLRELPAAGLLLVLGIAVEQGVQGAGESPQRPWQAEMALAGSALGEVLPDTEPVGCFHAGIVSWERAGPVVNLDGVVHRAAFEALRAQCLDAFLDERGICFLLDTPVQFRREDPWPHASGRWFGARFDPERELVPLVRFDRPDVAVGPPGTEAFVLYWRRGHRQPPAPVAAARDLGRTPDGRRRILVPARAREVEYALHDGPRVPLPSTPGVTQVLELAPLGSGGHALFLDHARTPALTW